MPCFLTNPIEPTVTAFGIAKGIDIDIDAVVISSGTFLNKKIVITRGKRVMGFETIYRIKQFFCVSNISSNAHVWQSSKRH
jgi:hypothetical protein